MPLYYKKRLTPETMLKKSIKDLLHSLGIFHFSVLQGLGSYPGTSDILAVYRGRFVAIEVKAPGGHPSGNQRLFLERVRSGGGIAILAYSVDDVIRGLGVEDRFLNYG